MQLDLERNKFRPSEVCFEHSPGQAADSAPQPRKREQCCTPVLADGGGVYQLTSRFKKSRDESESFGRNSVDGCERILDFPHPLGDIRDPWYRVIDLYSTKVKDPDFLFSMLPEPA